MRCVSLTKAAEFLKLKFVRGIFLILLCCVISSFALPAGKDYFISHNYSLPGTMRLKSLFLTNYNKPKPEPDFHKSTLASTDSKSV